MALFAYKWYTIYLKVVIEAQDKPQYRVLGETTDLPQVTNKLYFM